LLLKDGVKVKANPADSACRVPRVDAEMLPHVYDRLCHVATHLLAEETKRQNRQAAGLVHDAWLRVHRGHNGHWKNLNHFYMAMVCAMRRTLVEKVRHDRSPKHGGGIRAASLEEVTVPAPIPSDDIVAVDEALGELNHVDSQAASLIHIRFFGGFTQAQAASMLNISRSSADRIWTFARAWLSDRIRDGS